MTKLFADKVALVTGGSSGIGRATAIAFAKEGTKVVIAARREQESQHVLEEIKAAGSEGLFVRTDVTKLADLQNMIHQTITRFGRLDFAFNNAGIEELPTPLAEKTEALYQQIMDINVKGVLFSMQQEISAMLKNGGGVIINTSSIAGLIGMPNIPIYIASKHAVIGLTKSTALEYAKQNIRVNAISPAGIETEMLQRFTDHDASKHQHMADAHPIGRVGTPEEIASAVIWLCSSGAGFVTGHTMTIDGGFTAQ